MIVTPLEYFNVSTFSCGCVCYLIPRRAFTVNPLQYLKVSFTPIRYLSALSTFSGNVSYALVPRIAMFVKPFQNFKISTKGCTITCPFTPWTALAVKPLQYVKVSIFGCNCMSPHSIDNLDCEAIEVLQGVHVVNCYSTCTLIPWTALRDKPLKSFKVSSLSYSIKCFSIP